MMSASAFARRAGVAALVLALLGAFGWVLFRTGPLAPIRVTTVQVEEGALAPATRLPARAIEASSAARRSSRSTGSISAST